MDNDSPDVGRKRRDRMRDILERVREQGSTSTDELIRACGVSAATVRRDLGELEARGLVVRSYGRVESVGALPSCPS